MPPSVPLHGRDHCSYGADPIPCLGDIPWIRLKQLDLAQAWTATGSDTVFYDNVVYSTVPDGTLYFESIGSDGEVYTLVSGLYQATFRAFPVSHPANGFAITFSGIDWDEWVSYSRFIQGSATSVASGGYSEVTFRMGALNSFLGLPNIFVDINTFGTAMTLSSVGGTYLEIRRLGDVEAPRGLDNGAAE